MGRRSIQFPGKAGHSRCVRNSTGYITHRDSQVVLRHTHNIHTDLRASGGKVRHTHTLFSSLLFSVLFAAPLSLDLSLIPKHFQHHPHVLKTTQFDEIIFHDLKKHLTYAVLLTLFFRCFDNINECICNKLFLTVPMYMPLCIIYHVYFDNTKSFERSMT